MASIQAIPMSYLPEDTQRIVLDFPKPEVQWIAVWLDGTWIAEDELQPGHRRFGPFQVLSVNASWNHQRISEWVRTIV